MNLSFSCYTMGLHPLTEGNVALKKQQLDNFLAGIEKRAYKMALVIMGNREDALDAVQEAMMQLVAKYHHKDEEEWPKLFFRILRNKSIDIHRKRKVQNIFGGWLRNRDEDEGLMDPLDMAPAPSSSNPEASNQTQQSIEQLHRAVAKLSSRQQQAFLLRCWEGFNTAETAATMGCSEGSVKTHYSRALKALKASLGDYYEQI